MVKILQSIEWFKQVVYIILQINTIVDLNKNSKKLKNE